MEVGTKDGEEGMQRYDEFKIRIVTGGNSSNSRLCKQNLSCNEFKEFAMLQAKSELQGIQGIRDVASKI